MIEVVSRTNKHGQVVTITDPWLSGDVAIYRAMSELLRRGYRQRVVRFSVPPTENAIDLIPGGTVVRLWGEDWVIQSVTATLDRVEYEAVRYE